MEDLNKKTVRELKDIARSLNLRPLPRLKKDLVAAIADKGKKRSIEDLRDLCRN